MWNAKNAMLKNLIAIKFDQLVTYKKIYHTKGTFNEYDSNFMTGVIDELQREIDMLQDLLKSYNELDKRNGGK